MFAVFRRIKLHILVINSNFGPNCYRLRDITHKDRKSLNFPTPPFFEAPFGGNPLEFGDEIWRQKTRIVPPDGEEIMTLAFFILTQ